MERRWRERITYADGALVEEATNGGVSQELIENFRLCFPEA